MIGFLSVFLTLLLIILFEYHVDVPKQIDGDNASKLQDIIITLEILAIPAIFIGLFLDHCIGAIKRFINVFNKNSIHAPDENLSVGTKHIILSVTVVVFSIGAYQYININF